MHLKFLSTPRCSSLRTSTGSARTEILPPAPFALSPSTKLRTGLSKGERQKSDCSSTQNFYPQSMNAELVTPITVNMMVQSYVRVQRIPSATYRLQFHRDFTFRDATRIVSYLHDLGISDCYASPYLKAAPGSMHGYDVSDHGLLNPEVGSNAEYQAWVAELQHYDMGQLLDLVPNHMGILGGQNPWWLDVLENGPSSPYASFFDIDWHSQKPDLENKVLLPILGDQYGRVLENQDLHVVYEAGSFTLVVYGQERLPIAPRSMAQLLNYRLDLLERQLGVDHPAYVELQSIVTALSHLPLRTETETEKVRERLREKQVIKRRLAVLTTEYAVIGEFLAENLRLFNGEKGDSQSFDHLDALLADQAYRLAYWRVAAEEINYRRFFDVNALIGLCAENPAVFVATHQFVLRLFAEGKVNGFRVDHIDGLYDPSRYLRRLQHACAALRAGLDPTQLVAVLQSADISAGNDSDVKHVVTSDTHPCYVICEKILNAEERLPEAWPVHGTSGYDFLSLVNGLFVDPQGERPCTEIYTRFTGTRVRFSDLGYDSKKLIMQVALSSELNVLAQQLRTLAATHRYSRDFTLNLLRHALREIVACFPVYRTYIDHSGVAPSDRVIIERAVTHARRRNPATDTSVFNFVRDVLLLNVADLSNDDRRLSYLAFVMKFQQYTGPVMAKGLEDTAFYRYHRLVSLNEVGGTPDHFGTSLVMFHERNRQRQRYWPHSLLATTTHDSKRSEDVRARINVLSEIPRVWRTALGRWSKQNKKKKTLIDGQLAPDRADEYLFYQTLLGTWPLVSLDSEEARALFTQRLQAYMLKATKEAKVNTSWINPHQAYEEAVQRFVSAVLQDPTFLGELAPVAETVAYYGMCNSLSQTLLKLTVPGVPDIYQGNETWDFSLVDPDNRRPVDYEWRQRVLAELEAQRQTCRLNVPAFAASLTETWKDGRIKLYVTSRTLTYRRDHAQLFQEGAYLPVEASGDARQHVCAFVRRSEHESLIVAIPRLLARLHPNTQLFPLAAPVWQDTRLMLPPEETGRQYCNLFTGEQLSPSDYEGQPTLLLAEVFARFPVALLSTRHEERTGT